MQLIRNVQGQLAPLVMLNKDVNRTTREIPQATLKCKKYKETLLHALEFEGPPTHPAQDHFWKVVDLGIVSGLVANCGEANQLAPEVTWVQGGIHNDARDQSIQVVRLCSRFIDLSRFTIYQCGSTPFHLIIMVYQVPILSHCQGAFHCDAFQVEVGSQSPHSSKSTHKIALFLLQSQAQNFWHLEKGKLPYVTISCSSHLLSLDVTLRPESDSDCLNCMTPNPAP